MRVVEAAEDGFARANAFYLLMWAAVGIVAITSLYERRAIDAQIAEANRTIEAYGDLLPVTQAVDSALQTLVLAGPHPEDERKTLAALRANAARTFALVRELRDSVATRTDLGTDQRVAANTGLNRLSAILSFNSVPGAGPALDGEPKLLLAETDFGTIVLPATLADLRIGDAARYLWLASLPMRAILDNEEALRDAAASRDLGETLAPFVKPETGAANRVLAERLWTTWLKAAPPGQGSEPELDRMMLAQMRLAEPLTATVAAYRQRAAATARGRGELSKVALPAVAVPVRLSDAIFALPWFLAVCLTAIAIYLGRGLRYGTLPPPEGQVVAKFPVFFALNSVNPPLAHVAAVTLVGLPILIALVAYVLGSAGGAGWAVSEWLFLSGLGLDLILLGFVAQKVPAVIALFKQGIASQRQ